MPLAFLRHCAAALTLASLALAAAAQYPSRPVTIVVPFPPGGSQDVIARAIANQMQQSMKQSVVVENRPGAGGNIGAQAVARAAPDGHMVLAGGAAISMTAHLQKGASFDPAKELVGTSLITAGPFVLVAHPSAPFQTLEQFIAYARANPGKVNYGSQGPGSVPHLAMEYFRSLAKVDLVHVPYKGAAPNVQAVLAGEVPVTIESAVATTQHIRAGKLRPLAVTFKEPLEAFPDVPPIAKVLPGYELAGWQGLFVPAATPPDVRARLSEEIHKAVRSAEVSKLLRELNTQVRLTTPQETDAWVRSEYTKWGKVIADNRITAE
ncbi:MAG TPA: tripartite tricarboxylate transporter substrate binding protein [Ramlibacter sp.]|nr:tripartite tricarboxylate transporter substrate binding protein [Ramlibacter sp.]